MYNSRYLLVRTITFGDIKSLHNTSASKHFPFVFYSTAVLNDFEAVGYGITVLKPAQLVDLNPDAVSKQFPSHKGPIVCMGPGTGLGVAQVVWDDALKRYHVLPSEGAHGTFAPRGDLQRELQAWVEANEGYCETEQVACGKGLLRIYTFFSERAGREAVCTKPAHVTAAAAEGDALAQQALQLFLVILGQEAGNKALMTLATGGVFLAGGITPKVCFCVVCCGDAYDGTILCDRCCHI